MRGDRLGSLRGRPVRATRMRGYGPQGAAARGPQGPTSTPERGRRAAAGALVRRAGTPAAVRRPRWRARPVSPRARLLRRGGLTFFPPRRPQPCCPWPSCLSTCTCSSTTPCGSAPCRCPARGGRRRRCSDAEVLTRRGRAPPARAVQRARLLGGGAPRLAALLPGAAGAERVQPARALAVGRLRGPAPAGAPPAVPEDPWQQVDTTALPVKHPSRVRGADAWAGPGRAGGRLRLRRGAPGVVLRLPPGGAHDLGSRLVRAWGLVPAAVDERAVADGLLDARRPPGCCSTGASWAPPGRGAPCPGHAGPPRARAGRAPGAAGGCPAPRRGAAQSRGDDHRRADRGPRPGPAPGQDRLGPAHANRRDHPGPYAAAPRLHLTSAPTSRAQACSSGARRTTVVAQETVGSAIFRRRRGR